MLNDQRKFKRVDSVISGQFYSQADNLRGEMMVIDSSRGGFKAAFDKPIIPGGVFCFQVTLQDKKMPIFTTGKVAWIRERGQNRIYNFDAGVQLLEIDSLKEQKISEYDLGNWHIRQIADYALHKGYFAKRLSHKPFEILAQTPVLLLAYIVLGAIASFVFTGLALFYSASLLFYFAMMFIWTTRDLFRQRSGKISIEALKLILPVSASRISSHITYGVFFLLGIFRKRL